MVTNAGIIARYNSVIADSWLSFVVLEHVLVLLVIGFQHVIPPTAELTTTLMKRHNFLSSETASKQRPLVIQPKTPDFTVNFDDAELNLGDKN
jgi:hypothetical protein